MFGRYIQVFTNNPSDFVYIQQTVFFRSSTYQRRDKVSILTAYLMGRRAALSQDIARCHQQGHRRKPTGPGDVRYVLVHPQVDATSPITYPQSHRWVVHCTLSPNVQFAFNQDLGA